MTIVVPQPGGLEWQPWASAFLDSNPGLFDVPYNTDEDQWMEWASVVVMAPSIAGYQLPYPQGFDDWRVWAEALSLALVAGL